MDFFFFFFLFPENVTLTVRLPPAVELESIYVAPSNDVTISTSKNLCLFFHFQFTISIDTSPASCATEDMRESVFFGSEMLIKP